MSEQPSRPVLTHIGLTVPDLDRASAWYRDVLGFRTLDGPHRIDASEDRAAADVFGPAFRSARVIHLAGANGVCLELFAFEEPAVEVPAEPRRYWQAGLSHLCLVADDLESVVRRVVAHGGEQLSGIWRPDPAHPYRFVHVRDPFGNLLEFYSHPHEQVHSNRDGDRA